MSELAFHTLQGDGSVPNNPLCPAIHYTAVFDGDSPEQMADAFERLFEANDWPPAWRNGIFSHHHFHTTAHEVLGIYAGNAQVQLGGEHGPIVSINAGDVVVVPAGVGHCKLSCNGQLGVTAAYPSGQHADMQTPDANRYPEHMTRVSGVALPQRDPVQGIDGALLRRWQRHESTV